MTKNKPGMPQARKTSKNTKQENINKNKILGESAESWDPFRKQPTA